MTRLIDANALKNDLITFFPDKCLEGITAKTLFKQILTDIENAPTVEVNSIIDGLNNEIDDLSENLAWYINERNRLLKERRPQGEWIEFADFVARNVVNEDFSEDVDFYAEVLCRKLVKLGLVKLDGDTYKYCGADMRGNKNDV